MRGAQFSINSVSREKTQVISQSLKGAPRFPLGPKTDFLKQVLIGPVGESLWAPSWPFPAGWAPFASPLGLGSLPRPTSSIYAKPGRLPYT